MKSFATHSCILLSALLLFAGTVHCRELKTWPRQVKVSSGTITIYQPQIESLDKNLLKGRAAIAFNGTNSKEPVFGVAWFKGRVQIDRDQRLVHYETLEITDSRFPKGNEKIGEEFSQAVHEGMKKWNLTSSLDSLVTALAAVRTEQKEAADIKTDPPAIIYMDKPALLVTVDGKPVLQKIENSSWQAVANTPYPLFFDGSGNWHLNAAEKVWYRAENVDGPYHFDSHPPEELVKMIAGKRQQEKKNGDQVKKGSSTKAVTADNAPAIVVVHTPTELIVSDGRAKFEPLTDDLLAMSNTSSDVFMDVKSQNYFLVVSGRWYKSTSMTGRWQYVHSGNLPASFAKIPKDSKYGNVLTYVAGTPEAKEAVMDAQVPQTATVKRGPVDIKVTYDGTPKFEKIKDTNLSFAVNCSDTVIKSGTTCYLVKDAVWYLSDHATGPWQVSDHAPPGIGKVPPSSPVYNTKYVYVYESTPDVVYVGYTPGYLGSYVYGPTIVYGTGWYYSPWVSPYFYYPRPATWGFNVSYNPWTGWGFGLSWSSGPFHLGFYTGGGFHGFGWGTGWWGPGGFRPAFNRININNVNIRNSFNNISRRNNLYRNSHQRATIRNTVDSRSLSPANRQKIQDKMNARRNGRPAWNNDRLQNRENHSLSQRDVEQRRENFKNNRAGGEMSVSDIRNKAAGLSGENLRNNVMADDRGNVFRNQDGKWQQRVDNNWQNRNRGSLDGSVSSRLQNSGYNRPSSLDRTQFSRQRATERTRSFRNNGGEFGRRFDGGGFDRGGFRGGGFRGGGGFHRR